MVRFQTFQFREHRESEGVTQSQSLTCCSRHLAGSAVMLKALVGLSAGAGVAATVFLHNNFRVVRSPVGLLKMSLVPDLAPSSPDTHTAVQSGGGEAASRGRKAVIVGGGIVGLATAFYLRSAGFRVRLLDAEERDSTVRASSVFLFSFFPFLCTKLLFNVLSIKLILFRV